MTGLLRGLMILGRERKILEAWAVSLHSRSDWRPGIFGVVRGLAGEDQ
jgi:hypothetical protein